MKDKGYLRLIILYGTYFIGLGTSSFTNVFLAGKGMTNSQIGLILSVPPLLALAAQPLWGMASDRAQFKRNVVAVGFLLTGASCLFVKAMNGFIPLMIAFTVYNAVSQGLSPIMSSICMEYSANTKSGFGPIRMSGSITYQLVVLVLGFILSDDMPQLFGIMACVYFVCAAYALVIPPVKGYQHASEKRSPFAVFRDKRILLLLLMTFCGKTAALYCTSFYNKYTQELFSSNSMMSILAFLAIVLEIPFLFFSNRLMKKYRVTTWVLIGLVVTALRFIGISLFTSFPLMCLLQLPQVTIMACFEFYPSLYTNSIVAKELRGSMQSVNVLFTFGISQFTGTLFGGFLADALGIRGGFMVYGIFLLVMTLVFLPFVKKANLQWSDGAFGIAKPEGVKE